MVAMPPAAKKPKLADGLDAACASAATWLTKSEEEEETSKWVPLMHVKVRTTDSPEICSRAPRSMPLAAARGAGAGAAAPQPLGGRRILSLAWDSN